MGENTTKLVLEYAKYKKMVIIDVNNYIGVYTNGKVKKKGIFETTIDYHKNPSYLIIPKALEAYFVEGKCWADKSDIRNYDTQWKRQLS